MRARSSAQQRSKGAAQQGAGWLVFVSLAKAHESQLAAPAPETTKGASLPTAYMTRVAHWHTFDVVGFLVEAQLGAGGACVLDAVLAGPLAALAWLQAQAQGQGQRCLLHTQTHTLRLRWDTLQSLAGIKAIAVGAPASPLSTTEAARLKAFAASLGQQQEDLSERAHLSSARGRKAFLPRLVGDMLVATGHLKRDDAQGAQLGAAHAPRREPPARSSSSSSCWPFGMFSSGRRPAGKWTMPELEFVAPLQRESTCGSEAPEPCHTDGKGSASRAPCGHGSPCAKHLERALATASSTCSSADTARLLGVGCAEQDAPSLTPTAVRSPRSSITSALSYA